LLWKYITRKKQEKAKSEKAKMALDRISWSIFYFAFSRRYLQEPAYVSWAHADARSPSRLASGSAPSNPGKSPKAKRRKNMKTAARVLWLKLRVSREEKAAIAAKAEAQGQTVTDFLRQRALDYRLRQTPLEKERVRQLARIGVNLNQLARWANAHKGRAEALEMLIALACLEREARAAPKTEDGPCT
jgi:uncharacterized protein (DUF1778 family)